MPGLRRIAADFGASYAATAFVAFLFATSGPVVIILSVGARGGLSESDIASWIFAAFCLNSVISIAFTLAYRQPLVFLWSIPGAVLVGPALGHLSFPEVIGAFVATGLLMLLLGLSGWVRRAMDAVPMPVVMAMVAGVYLRFGVDLVLAFRDGLWIALPMTAAFVLLTMVPMRSLPPLIGALITGAIAIAVLGAFKPPPGALFALAAPNLYVPQFSWAAMVELVVPLAITVLAVQNAQGIAILAGNGHQAPVNAITAACGVGSIVTGLVGAVSTCLTGPVNAVLSSTGEKSRQYTSALFFSLLAIAFGLLAPFFTRLLLATPPAFIAALAGLAMLRVLQTAFTASFGGRFSLGALVCFLVTVADVPMLHIGAPFWGLLFGLAASWLLERRA
ncbi:MAG TPA: benzoate/H(+) symporter BenE family transporter [Burkholderiales bacterium]|nr:benzoate/H(+) symporter BenE family transporter [Burkholderiales bacterium]